MDRIQRFIENTGTSGWIRLGLIVLGSGLMIWDSAKSGTWVYIVPVLLLMLLATYMARHWLVKNLRTVRPIMSGFAVVAILGSFLFRGWAFSNTLWFHILLAALLTAYLGAYFWLVSDPRIVTVR